MTTTPDEIFATDRLSAHRLHPGDEERLQALFQAAGDYFVAITGRPEPAPDAAQREIQACAANEGRDIALLVHRESGEPVGAMGWWRGTPEPGIAILGMLLLPPEHRRQGYAREAVAGLESWLAPQEVERLRSGVAYGDKRSQAVLEALGFTALDQRTHVSTGDRSRLMISFYEREIS